MVLHDPFIWPKGVLTHKLRTTAIESFISEIAWDGASGCLCWSWHANLLRLHQNGLFVYLHICLKHSRVPPAWRSNLFNISPVDHFQEPVNYGGQVYEPLAYFLIPIICISNYSYFYDRKSDESNVREEDCLFVCFLTLNLRYSKSIMAGNMAPWL